MRSAARRRRPHLVLACVVVGLAFAEAPAAAAIAGAIAAAGAGWIFRPGATLIAAALVLTGTSVGAMRLEAIDRPARAAPPGSVIEAEATLLERPRPGMFGASAPMQIDTGPARALKLLARTRSRAWPGSDPGTRFRIRALVRAPSAGASARSGASTPPGGSVPPGRSGPGGGSALSERNAGRPGTPGFGPLPADDAEDFDFAAFLRSRGIGREASVLSIERIGRRGGIAGLVDSVRQRAEAGIAAGASAETRALARGMVLGEDGDIAEDTRDDFRRSGLAHLLAASGQNVALLCALAFPFLTLSGASPRARVAILLPLVALYVLLAGAGASIFRAGVMAAAGLIALALGRRASAVYALLVAATVTLTANPRATADPGWRLSFVAVAGMLALGPPLARVLSGLPRLPAEAVGITLAATLATAPLMAHEFGAVSIVALPANLLAIPAVAPVMWIGMAQATLAQAGQAADPLIQAASLPASWALDWIAGVARWAADRSWAQLEGDVGVAGMAVAYALVALLVIAAIRGRRMLARVMARETLGGAVDRVRALPARTRVQALALASIAATAWIAAGSAAHAPRATTVDFIDVGQGDATLIRDAHGAAVLFDGGPPEARVDRALRRLGVRRLAVVVATHQSRDHHGGLLQVVRRFPVGLFLDGGDGTADPTYRALLSEVRRRRIPQRPTRAGETLTAGTIRIRVLWPPGRPAGPAPADPNPRATVAVVSVGSFDLFLSADAESGALAHLALPRVEAMKVPHHGSADPGLPAVLDRLRPAIATIEVGRGNRYAHPRRPTLDALRDRVPHVFRTDRDGTVELTVRAGRVAIRTQR